MNEELFQYQETETDRKKDKRPPAMVMFPVTVIKGIAADAKGQKDHSGFKPFIINDVHAKQWQAADK